MCPSADFAASIVSWCARRCMGRLVWNAITLLQPSFAKRARSSSGGMPQLFVVVVRGEPDSFDRAADVVGRDQLVQVANPRMIPAAGAEDALRLAVLVDFPAGVHLEDRQHETFAVPQRDPGAGIQGSGHLFLHIQRHRHRPQRTAGKTQVLEHRFIGCFVHEARQRSETAIQQQL